MGAEPIPLDFGTQSDPGRYGPETGPHHINAYVEKTEEGQPPYPIYATPGLDLFSTITNGGKTRGMAVVDDSTLLVLSGNVLATVNTGGTATSVGTITGNKNVFMARNANDDTEVAIVNDGQWYIYNNGSLGTVNPDTDLPAPNSCFFLDQRIIYTISDGRFFWSAIDDADDIDSLAFSTAEGAPDGLVRGFGHKLDGWLYGKETTEIWRATSNSDQPFLRQFFIPIGCSAPHSVAALDDIICWVGHDDIPYVAAGYTPQPLVHGGVCRDIKNTANKTDIIGFGYYEGGYAFWELSGPTWTWVYNLATARWFEKTSYDLTKSRGQFGIRFANSTIVGDYNTNVLYKMNASTFDENGAHLVFKVRSPAMHAYPNRISVDQLHLDMITGVGNADDTDPQVMLKWSDNGGRTFAGPISKDLGAAGDYTNRIVFNNLGTTGRQGRIWEVSVSSPVVRGMRYAAIYGDKVGT